MSLATLKAKVQKLIDKARYGNIYEQIFKNEDIDLIIPDDITVIEAGNAAPLSAISTSGKNVEQIKADFFTWCTNLEVADFPKLKSIGTEAFCQCKILKTINMPLLQSVGNDSFFNCAMTTVSLLNLKTIEHSAFSNCANLTEINTPNLISIGSNVIFGANKVTKMTVGALTETSNNSFRQVAKGTGALTELYVGQGTSADLYLQYSEKYPQSILHGIIENLADRTGKTTGIFSVGDKNLEKIDDEHKAILNQRNWVYK